MDYATFIRQAEKGEPPAITLLHGGDVQLLDDALDAATRGLFPDRALAAWGREVFDGREDTATLLGEARKAALAGGADNRNVGVKDVGSIVGEQRLDDIFDLTRAVERRDRAGALKMLDRLLATEDAMLLLTVLARDVRTA